MDFLLHNVERNSFRKRMHQHEKNQQFFFFFWGGRGCAVYTRNSCLDSPRVANLGRCHAYLGCRNMLLRDFHLPLFVTDKWVKCYCELILGLASLSMIFDFYFILQLYDTEITFNMQFVSIDNYRLGTNFGHFQAFVNVLRFTLNFPAKCPCTQLLHILSIL